MAIAYLLLIINPVNAGNAVKTKVTTAAKQIVSKVR